MNKSHCVIREAVVGDLGAINDIYNHFVLNSVCTYQEVPDSLTERRKWYDQHDEKHPITVASIDGTITAWGSLSKFRDRSAYRFTVENSVYVHHQYHKQGLGSAILGDLVTRAKALSHHTIIAGIDSEQAGSIALHSKFGFQKVAQLKQVGYKHDRWLDVVYMELLF